MASLCRFRQLFNVLNSQVNSKNLNHLVKNLSTTQIRQLDYQKPIDADGKIRCTLIPGDGVGPELCASVKEVISAMGAPLEFEELFLSELNPTISVPVETAIESIKRNQLALKGILSTPSTSGGTTGELQSLNMKIRYVNC